MKKPLLLITILAVGCLSLFGCNNKESTNESSSSDDKIASESTAEATEIVTDAPTEEPTEEPLTNSASIDGITITANYFTVEPYESEDGYTKKITVSATFKNETDKAFGYISSCSGYLKDGFKLQGWSNFSDLTLKQIPSNGSVDTSFYFLANDSVTLDQINLTYDFMDYNEEYWDDFGKIMSGEMTQTDYENKYSDIKEVQLTVLPQ